MGRKAAHLAYLGPDAVFLSQYAHFLGATDDLSAQCILRLIPHEQDGTLPPGDIVSQMMFYSASGTHSGTGNDDGLQEIVVNIYKGSDASGILLLTIKVYKVTV